MRSREFGLLKKWHLSADLEQREKRRREENKIESKKVLNLKTEFQNLRSNGKVKMN